jgi:hypothetical protein
MNRLITIPIALLALAAVVQAGSISHTVPYGPLSIPDNSFVLVPQYNGTFGSLLSVKVELIADAAGGEVEWDNEDSVGGTVTLAIRSVITATGPNLSLQLSLPGQAATAAVLADSDGSPDYAGNDWSSVASGTEHGEASDTLTNIALFVPYVGPGNFQVDLASLVFTKITTVGASGESRATNGQATGTVKVTYEFTDVPEPATMGLLALGGIAALVRRRT